MKIMLKYFCSLLLFILSFASCKQEVLKGENSSQALDQINKSGLANKYSEKCSPELINYAKKVDEIIILGKQYRERDNSKITVKRLVKENNIILELEKSIKPRMDSLSNHDCIKLWLQSTTKHDLLMEFNNDIFSIQD